MTPPSLRDTSPVKQGRLKYRSAKWFINYSVILSKRGVRVEGSKINSDKHATYFVRLPKPVLSLSKDAPRFEHV